MRQIKPTVAWTYLGFGIIGTVVAQVLGKSAAEAFFVISAIQVMIVMAVAYRMLRVPRFLVATAASVCFFFLISTLLNTVGGSGAFARWGAAATNVCAEVIIASTFVWLIRQQHRLPTAAVVFDSLIVGLGAMVVTWVGITQPTIAISNDSLGLTLLDSFYQPADSIILVLMVVFLLMSPRRNTSAVLVASAFSLLFAADVTSALADAHQLGAGALRVATAVYSLALFTLGTAYLHPSVARRERTRANDVDHHLAARLTVTTLALAIPMISLGLTSPHGRADQIVRTISIVVLATAVTLRAIGAVRANAATQEALLERSRTDDLTGLHTRVSVLEHLTRLINDIERHEVEPAVFMIDIDRFRNINDSLSHDAGDELLCIIARRLVAAVPAHVLVARFAGDEFVVIDPGSTAPGASALRAEQLMQVFREPVSLQQGDVFITASIGVATIHSMAARPDKVLRNADTAVYRAKDSGRNCVAHFDDSMREQLSQRLALETALYRALDRRELQLFHQPILDVETGQVSGFEALMRWHRKDGTIVSPAEFIPIAEETGIIVPIGAWALLDALSQLRSWIDEGICSPTATMSVNVSPRQLADPNLPAVIDEALTRSGVSPEQLWVEITESVMITNATRALATMQRLRAMGVRIALDDFGTGYSSLSLLQRFPVQRIKIDRAFVQGVADNESDQALVRAIIAMAHSLELDLVAEGVETLSQMQMMWSLGCSKAQGYLISQPVPAAAMRTTVAGLQRIGAQPLLRHARTTARV